MKWDFEGIPDSEKDGYIFPCSYQKKKYFFHSFWHPFFKEAALEFTSQIRCTQKIQIEVTYIFWNMEH